MDNFLLYVDLGNDIPQYAVMEILCAMRDNAMIDAISGYDYFVKCKNGFQITNTHGLGLCLLANARCVDMDLECIHLAPNKDGSLGIYFNVR